VLVVIGTRPEAIKMAPVISALEAHAPQVEVRTAFTGQHSTLVDQVIETFSLEPHYDLGIMEEGQTLYDVVHGALDGLRAVVEDFRPDVLLVQGDTATVFVGSLVGFFERVRVGHVEAGLRSHDKAAPYPEEVFRRLADVIADFYFAPTIQAKECLLAENVPAERVHVTGNTVVDALVAAAARERAIDEPALRAVVEDEGRRLVLLTAHRRESFGEPLRNVFGAVRRLADEVPDIGIVYPVHPNPNVAGPARELLSGHPRITLTEPMHYLDMVAALEAASLVLTDSGGIQEEAPTFGAPVLVLREVTERPEGVARGVAELVGTEPDRIVQRSLAVLSKTRSGRPDNPYGDGRAGERVADILMSELLGRPRRTEDWEG